MLLLTFELHEQTLEFFKFGLLLHLFLWRRGRLFGKEAPVQGDLFFQPLELLLFFRELVSAAQNVVFYF